MKAPITDPITAELAAAQTEAGIPPVSPVSPAGNSVRPSIPLGKRTDGHKKRAWFELMTPSQCIAFDPPADFILVGDCNLVRGGITVLGGAPGVGKSRAALALAVAGAKGADWMGHKVHRQFKTLVLSAKTDLSASKENLWTSPKTWMIG